MVRAWASNPGWAGSIPVVRFMEVLAGTSAQRRFESANLQGVLTLRARGIELEDELPNGQETEW